MSALSASIASFLSTASVDEIKQFMKQVNDLCMEEIENRDPSKVYQNSECYEEKKNQKKIAS